MPSTQGIAPSAEAIALSAKAIEISAQDIASKLAEISRKLTTGGTNKEMNEWSTEDKKLGTEFHVAKDAQTTRPETYRVPLLQ